MKRMYAFRVTRVTQIKNVPPLYFPPVRFHDGDRAGELQPAPSAVAGDAPHHGHLHAARHARSHASHVVPLGKCKTNNYLVNLVRVLCKTIFSYLK